MTSLTLAQTNGSKGVSAAAAWKRDSVETFFSGFNWEDHPPEVQEIKLNVADGSHTSLSGKMSVSQFFATVNWDGTVIAAPATPQSAPPPANNSLTLDDFSGLF